MDAYKIFVIFWIYIVLVSSQNIELNNAGKSVKSLTEKAYAKLFKERRKESKELLKIIKEETSYERRYKLLEGAYQKLLSILEEAQSRLLTTKYDPLMDKFPTQNAHLLDTITVTLENTCLFGEIIIHNPDISYRVLESQRNGPAWKPLINWCIKYTRQFNDRIIDTNSQELLSLTEQEINPEKRSADFINPYRESNDIDSNKQSKKKKKKAKKLPKGPKMVAIHDEF